MSVPLIRTGDPHLDRWISQVSTQLRNVGSVASKASRQAALVQQTVRDGNEGGGNAAAPTRPQNFEATGTYSAIVLSWEPAAYTGHAFTRIYRSDTDSFGSAIPIADVAFSIYSDQVGVGQSYYYWCRHINIEDAGGPINATAGTQAQTARDLDELFDKLERGINETYLNTYLSDQISLVSQLEQARQTVEQRVDTLNADTATLRAEIDTTKNLIAGTEDELNAVYNAILEEINESESVFQTEGAYVGLTNTLNNFINDPDNGLSAAHAKIIDVSAKVDTENENVVQQINGVSSQLNDPATGLPATRNYVLNEVYSKTKTNEAIGTATQALRSQIFSPTGQTVSEAFTGKVDQALATHDGAIAERFSVLETTLNDPDTGLAATRASLTQDFATKAFANEAASQATRSLKAELYNDDGSALNSAFTTQIDKALSDDNEAFTQKFSALDTLVRSAETGLAATRAKLINDHYTKSQANSAIASQVNTLQSKVFGADGQAINEAFATSLRTTKTANGQSLAQEIDGLRSVITDPDTGLTATRADITSNYYTKAQTGQVAASAANAVEAKVFGANGDTLNSAFVGQVSNAFSRDGESLAERLWSVESRAANTQSALSTAYYTKSQADNAITEKVSTLSAKIFNDAGTALGSAFINDVDHAFVSNGRSLSQRLSNLSSEFNSVVSSALTGVYTKSEADSAISRAFDEYTVEAGGNTGSIRTWAEVAYEANQKFDAQWGVSSTVNGLQAGVGLYNNGSTTLFAVQAHKFTLINPNTNATSNLFTVTQNDPEVPNGVYISQAFLKKAEVLDLIAGSVRADTVVAGISMSSPVINGGLISGGRYKATAGGYLIDLYPVSTLPIWYAPNGVSKTAANATFAVDRYGRSYARNLTVRQGDNIILDTDGVNGAYIHQLSVDSLAIKDNAITVPLYVESQAITGSSTKTVLDYYYNQSESAFVMVSMTLEALREGDVNGSNDAVSVRLLIYDGGGQELNLLHRDVYADSPGNTTIRHIIPVSGGGYVGSNQVRVRIDATPRVSGQAYTYKVRGFITSAKK